jgi:hypothetical protein
MDLWGELRAQVAAGNTPAAKHRRKTIGAMHLRHGVTEGRVCGDCRLFFKRLADMRVEPFKCRLFGLVGESSDWRKGYPACGRFEPRQD